MNISADEESVKSDPNVNEEPEVEVDAREFEDDSNSPHETTRGLGSAEGGSGMYDILVLIWGRIIV